MAYSEDSGEKTDGEGPLIPDGRENGWVWESKRPQIVSKNEVLPQSMSFFYLLMIATNSSLLCTLVFRGALKNQYQL